MENIKFVIEKSARIDKLVNDLYAKMPEIESARGVLVTESYQATEDLPIVKRRSAAFAHILRNIPIVIRDGELIVGSATVAPRGCQVFPEYSYEWLEAEFDTVATRAADPFYISEKTKSELHKAYTYWKGKTCSDLAKANMAPAAYEAFTVHGMFTPGNYFYNGIGHVNVNYGKVLKVGYRGIIAEAQAALGKLEVYDPEYVQRVNFLTAVIESCEAVVEYARRYAVLAREMAKKEKNPDRKAELERIAANCMHVPEFPQRTSTKRARASGLFSFFCRWNRADTPFPPGASISICIRTIKRISKRARLREKARKNCSTVFGLNSTISIRYATRLLRMGLRVTVCSKTLSSAVKTNTV